MSFDPAMIDIATFELLKDQETIGTDYLISRSTMWNREVCNIASPDGEPAAIPINDGLRDIDTQYNYIDGTRGKSRRLKLYNPEFNVDWIGAEQREQLKRWKHQNRKVLLGQGIGRHTRIRYNPVHQDLIAFRDSGYNATDHLRAGNNMTAYQTTNSMYWDPCAEIFRGPFAANSNCVIPTPGGAGLMAARSHVNRMIPSYPEGAAEGPGSGKSAWTKGGTAGDITFALRNNGFGHNQCPHSLRVTTSDAVSASRWLYMGEAWDSGDPDYQGYSFSGSGVVTLVLWVRGRFPNGALLQLRENGTPSNNDSISLGDYEVGDWRPLCLAVYSTNWSTAFPEVYLYLATTKKDPADFEIGPMFMTSNPLGKSPIWRDHSDGGSGFSYLEYPSIGLPRSGCYTASLYAPKNVDNTRQYVGVWGTDSMCLDLRAGATAGGWTARFNVYNPSSHNFEAPFTKLFDDEVWAISVQWGNGYLQFYLNGEKIKEFGTSDDKPFTLPNWSETLRLGYAKSGAYDTLPFPLLGFRSDEQVFTETEMKYLHSSMTDPGALAVSVPARGRIFRITKIPSTPRPSPRGTQWVGRLALEQVDYDPDLADITAKETNEW